MDYVYIDQDGNMLDQDDQPDQQAALQRARVLAVEYQAHHVCVAQVIRLQLEIPRCDCCGFRFNGQGELCPGCVAAQTATEPCWSCQRQRSVADGQPCPHCDADYAPF